MTLNTEAFAKALAAGIAAYEAASREFGGWIDWAGGNRPHPPSTDVEFKTRGGLIESCPSAFVRWWHEGSDNDIIAYRLAK